MTFTLTDLCIIVACVSVSLVLPRLPRTPIIQTFSRLLVCILVVVLCAYLPKTLGVPLALLLVLTVVPVMRLDVERIPILDAHTKKAHESFANQTPDEILEQFSTQKMGEKAIAEKMEVFTRLNSKQEEFKQQLNDIQQNLKTVREFYANEEAKYKKKK